MSSVHKVLHCNLELVLVSKLITVHVFLDAIKASEKINGPLLVARWRIFQVCYCALKLERVFVVFQKLGGDRAIKGHRNKAIVHEKSGKDCLCALTVSSRAFSMR